MIHNLKKVVELIIKKSANVIAQGDKYGNILYITLIIDYKNIMQLLVQKIVDVFQVGYHDNLLFSILSKSNKKIVQ